MWFWDISRAELEFDDNLVMSIVGFTNKVKEFFSIKESLKEATYLPFFVRNELIL